MAKQNPTGEGPTSTLTVDPKQRRILRPILEIVRAGIRDDLETYPGKLREPASLRREEEAAGCLLAALAGRSVGIREGMRTLVAELAESIDEGNEYERVVAEHEALYALLGQIEGALS
jgi:hypothetical protein